MCEEEAHEKTEKKSVESISYFNTKKERQGTLTPFERALHVNEGYKAKLHRDDREHTLNLDINGEERSRKIPVLSSSEYGRRPPIEQPSRDHARVSLIQRDFYRTSSEGTI